MLQEDAVGWDQQFDGPPTIWQEIASCVAIGIYLLICWKLLNWVARRRYTRYFLPSVMVAILALGLLSDSESIGGLALVPNGPILPVLMGLGWLAARSTHRLPVLLLGTPAVWFAWYGIIRFIEWRQQMNAPSVMLGLK